MSTFTKKFIGKVCLVVFALCSIYFSYQSLSRNATFDEIVLSVKERIPFSDEIQQLGTHTDSTILADDVILSTNRARVSADGSLAPLAKNDLLTISAQAKVDDMIEKGYFEHETPEGYNVEHFVGDAGYEYITVAENLASGDFADAEALVLAWMNSPGHRANIVNADVTEIGIAVAYTEFQGRKQYVAVQHFGRPRSSCPSINESLGIQIKTDEAELGGKEIELNQLKSKIEEEGPGGAGYAGDVEYYNQLVSEYNSFSESVKRNINIYNTGIRAFNECIAEL